jgi:hypothetical protein
VHEDDEDDDDLPEEFSGDPEESELNRQHGILGVAVIMKLNSGDTIVGTLITDTWNYLELRWPMLLTKAAVKVNNELQPMSILIQYAEGVFDDFITIDKGTVLWWNHTNKELDEFYLRRLPVIYPSYQAFKKEEKEMEIKEQRKIYPEEDDQELESLVTKFTTGKKFTNLSEMIDTMTGISKPRSGTPKE